MESNRRESLPRSVKKLRFESSPFKKKSSAKVEKQKVGPSTGKNKLLRNSFKLFEINF